MQQKLGKLCDCKLGPIDRGQMCFTCESGIETCPGHFGHIVPAKTLQQITLQICLVKYPETWKRAKVYNLHQSGILCLNIEHVDVALKQFLVDQEEPSHLSGSVQWARTKRGYNIVWYTSLARHQVNWFVKTCLLFKDKDKMAAIHTGTSPKLVTQALEIFKHTGSLIIQEWIQLTLREKYHLHFARQATEKSLVSRFQKIAQWASHNDWRNTYQFICSDPSMCWDWLLQLEKSEGLHYQSVLAFVQDKSYYKIDLLNKQNYELAWILSKFKQNPYNAKHWSDWCLLAASATSAARSSDIEGHNGMR